MPNLRRQLLIVQLVDQPEPVELEALNPDFLRVEAALPQLGLTSKITKERPLTFMTLVAWAACKRLDLYDGDAADFKNRDCLHLEVIKDAPPVDPTQPAGDTPSP